MGKEKFTVHVIFKGAFVFFSFCLQRRRSRVFSRHLSKHGRNVKREGDVYKRQVYAYTDQATLHSTQQYFAFPY